MLFSLLIALAALTLIWVISVPLQDVSIVDVFWAPGFLVIASANLWLSRMTGERNLLILGLIGLWALRLGLHLFLRWRRLGHEDRRYAAMRRKAGRSFVVMSLFTVFWLQAGIMWIVSLPLQFALAAAPAPLGPLDYVGGAIALAGIVIEGLADLQLTRFGRDPGNAGRVLNTGLWTWSRHPNYFGDAAMWWGLFFLCYAGSGVWWTVVSPIVMTYFLLRVSGVTLLERKITDRRPEYADYIARTSAFIPLPPKR